jgi:hypothetical protein
VLERLEEGKVKAWVLSCKCEKGIFLVRDARCDTRPGSVRTLGVRREAYTPCEC